MFGVLERGTLQKRSCLESDHSRGEDTFETVEKHVFESAIRYSFILDVLTEINMNSIEQ